MSGLEERLSAKRLRGGINYSLDRLMGPLEALGNPHLKLPPTIHVAGTNGKGSTVAFFGGMLRLMGKRVFKYTSPHITSYGERFEYGGDCSFSIRSRILLIPSPSTPPPWQQLSNNDLEQLLNEVEEKTAKYQCTEFELLTLMCFLHVSRENYDVLVLETGLGGRLDATNVVDPVLSVITRIGLDHQEYLGDRLTDIAAEKAGIIKANRPLIVTEQSDEVMAVIHRVAKDLEASVISCEPLSRVEDSLPDFQLENLALVMKGGAVLQELGILSGDLPAVADVVGVTPLPGRFEVLEKDGQHIVMDVAHNALGFAQVFREYRRRFPDLSPVVLVAVNRGRDPKPLLALCREFSDQVCYVDTGHPMLWSYSELLQPELSRKVTITQLTDLLSTYSENYLIIGSFYLMETVALSLSEIS